MRQSFRVFDTSQGKNAEYGPFETLHEARRCARAFDTYNIVTGDGAVVERERPRVPFPRFIENVR